MSDVLEHGPRYTVPTWATSVLIVVVTLSIAAWTVLTAVPPTIHGHGSRQAPPPSVAHQPLLGRPLL